MTSRFIMLWLRWLFRALVVLFIEYLVLGMTWSFFLYGQLTVFAFLEITWLIYGEWRSARASTYQCACEQHIRASRVRWSWRPRRA
jgi:hypothetical protein